MSQGLRRSSRAEGASRRDAFELIEIEGRSIEVEGHSIEIEGRPIEVEARSIEIEGRSIEVEGHSIEIEGPQSRWNHVRSRSKDDRSRWKRVRSRSKDDRSRWKHVRSRSKDDRSRWKRVRSRSKDHQSRWKRIRSRSKGMRSLHSSHRAKGRLVLRERLALLRGRLLVSRGERPFDRCGLLDHLDLRPGDLDRRIFDRHALTGLLEDSSFGLDRLVSSLLRRAIRSISIAASRARIIASSISIACSCTSIVRPFASDARPRASILACSSSYGRQVSPVSQLTCRSDTSSRAISTTANTIGRRKRRGPIEPALTTVRP